MVQVHPRFQLMIVNGDSSLALAKTVVRRSIEPVAPGPATCVIGAQRLPGPYDCVTAQCLKAARFTAALSC